MAWWMWLILAFVLLGLELIASTNFYLFFFGLAAIGVGIATGVLVTMPGWAQWLLFSVLAFLFVFVFRRPVLLLFQGQPREETDVDSMVGETAVAMEDIPVNSIGKAELRGTAWNAMNVGVKPLSRSERCKVEKVEGLMLCVRQQ